MLKARYKSTLLGKMVQVAEVYSAQLEEMANKIPAGCAGLSHGSGGMKTKQCLTITLCVIATVACKFEPRISKETTLF